MAGERNLARLLTGLTPVLAARRYAFIVTDDALLAPDDFALIREAEGLTVIRPAAEGDWALISLGVHSSLEAVGLTAAIAQSLSDKGISVNIVAALHHDHIFVPWERREAALAALRSFAAG